MPLFTHPSNYRRGGTNTTIHACISSEQQRKRNEYCWPHRLAGPFSLTKVSASPLSRVRARASVLPCEDIFTSADLYFSNLTQPQRPSWKKRCASKSLLSSPSWAFSAGGKMLWWTHGLMKANDWRIWSDKSLSTNWPEGVSPNYYYFFY